MRFRPKHIALAVMTSILLVAAFLIIRVKISPTIFHTHTSFLFSQLEGAYRSSLASGQSRALSSQEFLNRIPQWGIDWNSCRLQSGVIYDSWNTPIEIRMEGASIVLRSGGPDRRFNTVDDISSQISN
jgi:hypothetical protein